MIGSAGTQPGQFSQPRAIAAASDGRIFVIDRTGRVQRLSPAGNPEISWEMPDNVPGKGQPSGVFIDPADRVFVADTHHHRVIVYDREGKEQFRFGERGMGPGQFLLPTDVVVDSQGLIYVSEYGGNDRISQFTAQGEYLLSFGGVASGIGMLQRPSGLAVDADDNIWVADTGNHRLCCFDSAGELVTFLGQIGTKPGELRYPRDVAVLPDGSLAVADAGNARIAFFDREGRSRGVQGHPGRGNDGFNEPLNLAVAGCRLLVADSLNNRIVVSTWPALLASADMNGAATAVAVQPERE